MSKRKSAHLQILQTLQNVRTEVSDLWLALLMQSDIAEATGANMAKDIVQRAINRHLGVDLHSGIFPLPSEVPSDA